jgi:hypothetical protein
MLCAKKMLRLCVGTLKSRNFAVESRSCFLATSFPTQHYHNFHGPCILIGVWIFFVDRNENLELRLETWSMVNLLGIAIGE